MSDVDFDVPPFSKRIRIMTSILEVLSASGKTTIQDDILGNKEVLFLTLTDRGGQSDNRYYVCLSGKNAQRDWQAGDRIMVELGFLAYKHQGQWHISHPSDALDLIEISSLDNNKEIRIWEK
jgi:hypothetical protein